MLYTRKDLMMITWLSKYKINKMIKEKEIKVERIWKWQESYKKIFIEKEEFERIVNEVNQKYEKFIEQKFKLLKKLKKWKKVVEKKKLD